MATLRTLSLPVLTSLLCLSFTGLVWHQLHSQHVATRASRFEHLSTQIHARLQHQLDQTGSLLRSAQSHWARSGSGIEAFLVPLLKSTGQPGLSTLAHAPLLQAEELDGFIASLGQTQGTGFTIRPAGKRPLYAPIISALKADGTRSPDTGLDLFADPERQRTLTRARDTDQLSLSARLQLEQADGPAIAGFMIAAPLYAPAQAHGNLAERRMHLQGWVLAMFNTQQWIQAATDQLTQESAQALAQQLDLRITETDQQSPEALIYPTRAKPEPKAHPQLTHKATLRLGADTWQLHISTRPASAEDYTQDPANLAAVFGILLSGIVLLLGLRLSTKERHIAADKENLQESLQEAEERWRFALEGSGDGVWEWDIQAGKISYSPRCDSILGMADGHASQARIHPEDEAAERAALQACLSGQTAQYISEHRMLGEDGKLRWIAARGMVVARGSSGSAARMIGTMSDITERKTAHERIQSMAQLDPLTGLPNRTLFFDRLQQALRMAKRKRETLGLICLDIDQFKAMNNNFGRSVGDKLLHAVAEKLKDNLRNSDSVAYFGSDNFALLLPSLSSEKDIQQVCDKLLQAFASDFVIHNRHIRISISLGAATFPQAARSAETLLNRAQHALQQASQSGGNRADYCTGTGN